MLNIKDMPSQAVFAARRKAPFVPKNAAVESEIHEGTRKTVTFWWKEGYQGIETEYRVQVKFQWPTQGQVLFKAEEAATDEQT